MPAVGTAMQKSAWMADRKMIGLDSHAIRIFNFPQQKIPIRIGIPALN